jgi:hypothetical protein
MIGGGPVAALVVFVRDRERVSVFPAFSNFHVPFRPTYPNHLDEGES